MTAALAAAGVAVLVAAGIALVFSRIGGSSSSPCAGHGCATGTKQKTKAAPAGPKLRYRTVDRETGYFEGTIAIVNPGTRPMNTWTLTFTYPGADIHNVWEAVLQRKGQTVTIVNAMTAAPIAPGQSFEVQFGGAGHPAMPTGCRLNNAPCVFVR
ncbi:MAG: cellulose binding domain-containing protein [Actinoallomurus sp.]